MDVIIGLLRNSPRCRENETMIYGLPRPPSDFGAQIFFHAARHKGFEEGSDEIPVHQKV
jgi:hypothetical protein